MNSGNNYQTRFLDTEEYDLWDQFVENSRNGKLFHTTRWAKLIRQVFGREFQILAVFKKNVLQAGFLYWPKTALGYRSITRAPVTPYQGFVLKSSAKSKSSGALSDSLLLSNLLIEHLLKEFRYIDLATVPKTNDIRPFIWHKFSAVPKYTYTFPLVPFDELKRQFSQSLRRKINNYSATFEVRESRESAELAQFVEASYRHHGIEPPVSAIVLKKFFLALSKENWAHFYYLKKDGRLLAGLLLLEDSAGVYALFAGVARQAREEFVTEYLYTECMKQPYFSGKQFDFLGANTPEFEQFKRSFGGRLRVCFELNYSRGKTLRALSALRRKQHLLQRRKRKKS